MGFVLGMHRQFNIRKFMNLIYEQINGGNQYNYLKDTEMAIS